MNLNTDESYDLTVNTRVQGEFPRDEIIVHVSANSYYGARHGLETLSQLITFDALGKGTSINDVQFYGGWGVNNDPNKFMSVPYVHSYFCFDHFWIILLHL